MRIRIAARVGLALTFATLAACGSYSPAAPAPSPSPVAFDVQLTSSVPAAGGTLELASPNDTPVALDLRFSVTVPPGRAGAYFWTVAVQAAQPPGTGFVVPVVTTRAFEPVTLVEGTSTVSLSAFHTTNAVCSSPSNRPEMSTSLDMDIRTVASPGGPAFFGRRFPVTFVLHCR
jgi:hypothetical protein